MTPISRNADLYLPVRPGTDLALLMGMLHVILRDGLENRDFIAAHTTGFEAVAESVRAWDPRTAAEMTGVPPGGDRDGRASVCAKPSAPWCCTRAAWSISPKASRTAWR